MSSLSELEAWQRGPVEGVPALLQPVAHALLQAVEDVDREMKDFPRDGLFTRPWGIASPAFHLKHLSGVVDRLFTYARGEILNSEQLSYLKSETQVLESDSEEVLLDNFRRTVDAALSQLKKTDPATLTDARGIGRKQIPTTVIGLLFHAAEHSQRHVGQLLVTARAIKGLQQDTV